MARMGVIMGTAALEKCFGDDYFNDYAGSGHRYETTWSAYTLDPKAIDMFMANHGAALPSSKTFLDIGAAGGQVMRQFEKRGFFAMGIEINAKQAAKHRNITHGSMFDDAAMNKVIGDAHFDFVLCNSLPYANLSQRKYILDRMVSAVTPKGFICIGERSDTFHYTCSYKNGFYYPYIDGKLSTDPSIPYSSWEIINHLERRGFKVMQRINHLITLTRAADTPYQAAFITGFSIAELMRTASRRCRPDFSFTCEDVLFSFEYIDGRWCEVNRAQHSDTDNLWAIIKARSILKDVLPFPSPAVFAPIPDNAYRSLSAIRAQPAIRTRKGFVVLA
jgi:SAM-dependent methyltransferase